MRDAVAAHHEGIPTVVLVHGPFEKLARAQCSALGVSSLPLLVYRQDALARDSDDEIAAKAKQVAGQIAGFLLHPD